MVSTKFRNGIIYNDDCLNVLKELDDKSIDCVITDPPYNISRDNNFSTLGSANRIGMDFGEWDKGFDLTSYIHMLPRVLKENSNIVIFNAWENLSEIKKSCEENHIQIKRCLVLNKSNPAPFNRDRLFTNDVEFALWGVYNSKDKPTNWTFNRQNPIEKCVIDATVQESTIHPTMKDIKVIQHLVEVLSNPGDTVLDCFMGSGTTAVACTNANRNFVGAEISNVYYERSIQRLNGAELKNIKNNSEDNKTSLW